MRAQAVLGVAATLCGSAAAVQARDGVPADPTSPWVTLDDEGRPATTYTPSMTTISGTPSAVNGAPHDLTASVFTWTTWGSVSTSTGAPPNPTAPSSSKAGSNGFFSRCFNPDGDFAPFCRPSHNSTLLAGSTYYVTWDPDYYRKLSGGSNSTNSTYDVVVRLDFWNRTAQTWDKLATLDDQGSTPASWGFYPLDVKTSYLMGEKLNNLTITLLAGPHGSRDKKNSVALPIAVANPALPKNPPTPVPKGQALYIALPVCLGAFVLFLVGGCLWNRQTRRLDLRNIVERLDRRKRRGYTGRSTRRARRLFGGKKDDIDGAGISLATQYRDVPERLRRDSDELESLAESPIQGHNAFRDEIIRQDEERRHHGREDLA